MSTKITRFGAAGRSINRRQFALGTSVALGAGAFSGCSSDPNGSSRPKKKVIAVLFDGLYSPFWIAGHDAIIDDLEGRGYEVVEALSDQDDAKQLTQVKSMIARGVAGIIIVHSDSNAVIPAIREANRASVPMVHFNRAPAESEFFSVAVQADNRSITRETVERMVSVAKENGGSYKAAILIGDLGDQNAIARRDGFFDVVDKHSDFIQVVSRIPTNWNADEAFSGLTNALTANPDINFLFTSTDFMFPQIVQALKSANKWHKIGQDEHVVFGGFDGDSTAYQLLQDGYLDADGVQELGFEAKLCVDSVLEMASGKLIAEPSKPNPIVIHDPGFAIHQQNMEAVRERMWGYQVWKKENS